MFLNPLRKDVMFAVLSELSMKIIKSNERAGLIEFGKMRISG